jgi:two-component system sensor histidine kinase TctE
LLAWLLLPLVVLIALNAWWSYGRVVQVANEAYDRSLYLAARTLAEELQWVNGQLKLDVLRGAGYLFENHTGSRLFYRIDTPQGEWLAGNPGVPRSTVQEGMGVHFFALVEFGDAVFQAEPVRLAQLTHVIEGDVGPHPVLNITVVETREARDQLIAQVLRETLIGQAVLLLAVALLIVLGVQRGIRPIEAFRRRLAARADDDFAAIDPPGVPRELRPLMETLNGYLLRLGRLIDIRKRFLDNAAHQLRTPLTILKTQLALAERADSEAQRQQLMSAARHTTNDAVQLTEQLLALTRAEHASEMHSLEAVDLVVLARQATEERLLQAHERGDDLGFEAEVDTCVVQGVALLLHEAIANLIDNAFSHGGVGVRVTVRVGDCWMEVEDSGPGIAPAHQPHVFERFYSAAVPGATRQGSGLGLAIVREIALQHGARLQLVSPVVGQRGTRMRLFWSDQA